MKGVKYTCPYCAMAYNSIEELKGHVTQGHGTEPLPVPEGLIKLTINGKAYDVKVEPEWTLYYVLHDKLGFTGAKMFCDRGACGSCTVIMEGRPILSCMTLAIECDGKKIETIEALRRKNTHSLKNTSNITACNAVTVPPGSLSQRKRCWIRIPGRRRKK